MKNASKITIALCSLASAAALVFSPGCSSSSTSNPGDGGTGSDTSTTNPDGGGGNSGVVPGAQDSHCTTTVTVDPAACFDDGGMNMGDGGMPMDDAGGGDTYPPTMFNSEGDDDDCKYHVKWSATNVAQSTDVSFTVTLTNKGDKSPVRSAPIRAEVFLNDTHPAPNTNQNSTEGAAGVYTVGPIKFDASGKWTVRFHFHEECSDSETSPHGHAAFFVQVP